MALSADRLCSDHSHFSIAAFDELLNIPVEMVFEHYFTDSALFRDFVTAMKMSGKMSHQRHFPLLAVWQIHLSSSSFSYLLLKQVYYSLFLIVLQMFTDYTAHYFYM